MIKCLLTTKKYLKYIFSTVTYWFVMNENECLKIYSFIQVSTMIQVHQVSSLCLFPLSGCEIIIYSFTHQAVTLKCILHLLDLEPGVQSHDASRSQIVVVHAAETSLLHHVLELLLQQSKQISAANTTHKKTYIFL